MTDFFKLGPGSSVKEIQDTIARMPASTKEELLRHEKGGLLKRMIELDPNREYAEGEIWGNPPKPKPAATRAPTAAAAKPAAAPTPTPTPPPPPPSAPTATKVSVATPDEAAAPTWKKTSLVTPAAKASIDYSKFDCKLDDIDDDERIVDITDDAVTGAAPSEGPAPAVSDHSRKAAASKAKLSASKAAAAGITDEMVSSMGAHRAFTFVRLPADCNLPIEEQTGFDLGTGDVLPTLLAPLFKSDVSLDPEVVARESAARFKEMKNIAEREDKRMKEDKAKAGVQDDDDGDDADSGVLPPSAMELDRQAKMGVCEAWPLLNPSDETGWTAVKLYIDEVGALRKRTRNARAEALCAAVGQPDVAIHGDAFVARIENYGKWHADERNVDFGMEELAHNSHWVCLAMKIKEARGDAAAQAAAKGPSKKLETFVSGADEHGRYTWTQTHEDVEMRVLVGIPSGPTAKKRIKVSYGRGESVKVFVDGKTVLDIEKLFDRISPDDCSWCLDVSKEGTALVVTMEKIEPRAWVELHLPALKMAE